MIEGNHQLFFMIIVAIGEIISPYLTQMIVQYNVKTYYLGLYHTKMWAN